MYQFVSDVKMVDEHDKADDDVSLDFVPKDDIDGAIVVVMRSAGRG